MIPTVKRAKTALTPRATVRKSRGLLANSISANEDKMSTRQDLRLRALVIRGLRPAVVILCALGLWACGDDGGVSNDPGREVAGCFDCSGDEYCIILKRGAGDSFSCATTDCGSDCACLIKDGQARLTACDNYSCQDGAGILYCRE